MKGQAAASSDKGQVQHTPARYQKVVDGRKRPLRGLWRRGDRFYAQLKVPIPGTGIKTARRIPLIDEDTKKPVMTVAQAKVAMDRLKTQRADNALPVLSHTPKFSEYAENYLAGHRALPDGKRARTLETEAGHLKQWKEHLGETRLKHITKAMVRAFIAKRQAAGINGRTVNLALTCLNNVLKTAIQDDLLQHLPTAGIKRLQHTPHKRELASAKDIEAVCKAARKVSRNWRQFGDYVRLMAFSGGRASETLRLKWSDVDFKQGHLAYGSDGLAKNHKIRRVDFNPKLKALLEGMHTRCAPDSDWMFPSPQRGKVDKRSKTFRETLKAARTTAGFPKFGFHDCRHHFISIAVMAGIDFMTIAAWVGHQDGGILIGKVYGHLADEHKKLMAAKLFAR